ncbi:hypothetical protein, partial [Trichococcus pasteurii]
MSEAQNASLIKREGSLGCLEILIMKLHWSHDMQLPLNASIIVIFHIVVNHINQRRTTSKFTTV